MNQLFSEADLDPKLIELERRQLEREKSMVQEEKKTSEQEERTFDKKLFILDGYSIIYRSYFAHISSPLMDLNGENCSAYFGFFQTLFYLMSNYSMDYLAITMDEKEPTFRHKMYPEYKANRDKAPQDLHAQVPWIVETLEKMNITVLSRPGFEADDVIASLSKLATKKEIDTIMVTGDKDLCQLVSNHVFALRPPKKGESKYRLFKEEEVLQEYGVKPSQIVDYLSILGDASDNVPGIRGLGEKGAVKLLTEYLSFDGIYRHLDSLTPAVRKKLEEGRESGELSRELIKLSFDALDSNFDFSILDTSRIDKSAAVPDFELRKMKALARRAAANSSAKLSESEDEDTEENAIPSILTQSEKEALIGQGEYLVLSLDDADKKLKEIESFKGGTVVLDMLTQGFAEDSEIIGFSFSPSPKSAFFVPFYQEGKKLEDDRIKDLFDKYFASGRIKVVAHNAKYDLKCVWRLGSDIKTIIFDTFIASWMIDSNSNQYSLESLVSAYLNHTLTNIEDLTGKDGRVLDIPLKLMLQYSAENADYTYRMYRIFERRMHEKGFVEPFTTLELPLIRILAKMEREGIYLSRERMETMGTRINERLNELVDSIYKRAGHEFNLNSPMQLGKVLFEEMKLTAGKKTQKGFSTDTATLEAIKNEDPIVSNVLEYRQLNKLKTTYIDTLPLLADKSGRIHTSFLQTGTATGRLSSRNPNLQNIPIRTDEGRLIRDAFIPAEGNIFLSADYSQIELVVLAHMTGDENLQKAFKSGEDVHRYTASIIFGKPLDEVDSHERRIAKTINFGIMYGMSAFRLSNELGISRSEASEFIKKYFERYSGVEAFVSKTTTQAAKTGNVKTLFGHIREIPGINSANKTEKAAADRVAVNTVIQGTAAEIMKKAMIDISHDIDAKGLKSRILLQVHDELIFEVPLEEKETLEALVKNRMENAVKLDVPLRSSIEFGHSWGDMH